MGGQNVRTMHTSVFPEKNPDFPEILEKVLIFHHIIASKTKLMQKCFLRHEILNFLACGGLKHDKTLINLPLKG